MKNRNILNNIYNLISTIDNAYINIFIEEIYENQIELHLKNKKVKKGNIDYGVRIIIENNEEIKYKSLSFLNYEDMFYQVINYIQEILNLKLTNKYKKIIFKRVNNKNVNLNKQQKYKIMTEMMQSLTGYDSLKSAFYEKKENIFIIQNTSKYILNIKNFYTKVMLRGKIHDNEIFDFILSDHGYKNINKTDINNLVSRFKEISYIKTNRTSIENGIYDLILSNNCGTVFHEMLGHNLELDLVNKSNLDLFKKGNSLGNELITFIDSTSYKNLLNIKYDDYITKACNKVLINKGIVEQYISTSRSENYKYFPSTRMTNSYLKPNKESKLLNLKNVKNGIYVYKIGMGRLYLEEQKFEITIDAGYLIRDGKISGNISGISFIVEVSDFIEKINYIGNDLNFVPTVCGASSGNIFAYAGAPMVYVKDIYILQK